MSKLRIDFQVHEVAEDGDPPSVTTEPRFITFGDVVTTDAASLRDFFKKCGDAVELLFSSTVNHGACGLYVTPRGASILANGGKIEAIKTVRMITGLGLKEAKDEVELAMGNPGLPYIQMQKVHTSISTSPNDVLNAFLSGMSGYLGRGDAYVAGTKLVATRHVHQI